MIYKTTPATTLYLHHKSNHENKVTGNKCHDSDNDWIITRPEQDILDLAVSEARPKRKTHLKWKDVFWLRHANTGRYLHTLKTSQGFEVSAVEGLHSNNDWIVEETTWLREHILSDE
ncbi:hypothetical protein BG006_009291 [Podila minutissima]|uniref:MIR domain-containing protein n=1 Tax=Podila minutissima TaxID=64525 RepID=A0A9P5VPP9_9FUNG|nr:hypothetical protein BG006_009291 [Podila minutissima]